MLEGTVFNIQHFSIHDGPGIRTVVFLKGCPLHCRWCANPESQRPFPEMGWTGKECIGCRTCEQRLPELGVHLTKEGLRWDTDQKIPFENADRIRKTCPTEAFHLIGKQMSVEEVLSEVEKDRVFYNTSEGGLTLSGGEPLMQPEFSSELLKKAGSRGIHRAIETTGYASYEVFHQILSELDYLLMDVKTMNSEKHKEYTGVSNEVILWNLTRAREDFPDLRIRIRTPVIPGVNDSEEDITEIAEFLKPLHVEYELLKYHKLGMPKYESLLRPYPMGDVELTGRKYKELINCAKDILGRYVITPDVQ